MRVKHFLQSLPFRINFPHLHSKVLGGVLSFGGIEQSKHNPLNNSVVLWHLEQVIS